MHLKKLYTCVRLSKRTSRVNLEPITLSFAVPFFAARPVMKSSQPCFISTVLLAYIYVNCTDKFHTLRRRAVRRVYTMFLRAQWKKMRDLWPLLFSVIVV